MLTYKTSDSNHWINQQPTPGGASKLTDLTDVSINALTLGDKQTLTYNVTDTKWENKDPNTLLTGLTSDVTITSPSNGQVLTYNATPGMWENENPNIALSGLTTDVTIISPSDGQFLIYNGLIVNGKIQRLIELVHLLIVNWFLEQDQLL